MMDENSKKWQHTYLQNINQNGKKLIELQNQD